MARFDFYEATNMQSMSKWYGYATYASSTALFLDNYYNLEAHYYGTGFTYSSTTVTGGTMNSYYQYHFGELAFAFTGLSVSMPLAQSYLSANNIQGLFSIIAAGNDVFDGSL
jgi:hypothetical protein